MLQYVYDQPEAVAYFVAQLIPHVSARGFGKCKAIGVLDQTGKAIAGIVYHDYSPEAGVISISAASITPRWLTRETIKRMYAYPFEQLNVQMLVQLTPAEDERLLRQLAAGGYSFIKVPRLLGRDRDGVLCLLTREAWDACKFNKHRQLDEPAREAA